jgi:expansin (peptidoglycan-binding protein)
VASTLGFAAFLAFALASGCGSDGGGGGDTGGSGGPPPAFGACDGSPTYEGEGTYYAATGAGACSFDASSETPLLVGAMNAPDYGNSAVCGACAHLKGPNGEVTVRIVDLCPECAHGDIDLSPAAFELLAPLEKGRIPISWQFVPCGVSGPIVYHFKDGSNEYWTAVHIRNHRNAIAKFEYKAEDGSWRDVGRVEFNYFIDEQGMGPGPHTFRVTDVYGNVLEDTGIPLLDNADALGKAQFPACGN